MFERQQYWDAVYHTKAATEVSWFQRYPATSVELVEQLQLPLSANIIDIGGGDSFFANVLLERGFTNIWVLDISEQAIEKAKQRLGDKAQLIHWIVCDVTMFKPTVQFDLWHDRAAFHFLTNEKDINAYVNIAASAIKQHGYLIIATFSKNGPAKCSGLPVQQYSEQTMVLTFENTFDRMRCFLQDHTTPFNTTQQFIFCVFKKR